MPEPRQRMTKQRAAILDVLRDGTFRSAQDWHDRLKHGGSSIGLATVYRALQALVETGDVDSVVTETGETLYRLCSVGDDHHHHHLRCRTCGKAEDIDLPSLEDWANALGAERGYASIEHTVELTGVCSECTAKGL